MSDVDDILEESSKFLDMYSLSVAKPMRKLFGPDVDRWSSVKFIDYKKMKLYDFYKLNDKKQMSFRDIMFYGGKNLDVITYRVAGVSSHTHRGVLVIYENHVADMYCSCPDFRYRIRYAAQSNNLMSPSTVRTALRDVNTDVNRSRRRVGPARVTNPYNRVYLCKHLKAAMSKYV